MLNKNINNFFLIFFSIIPISIVAGPAVILINISIIDIFFLCLIIAKKEYSFLKINVIKYLFIFYIYLIFNSFISIDQKIGFFRNFGFLRFIILFIAFNYFFQEKQFIKKVLITWTLILSLILIDVFFESFIGINLAGFESPYRERIVSFFKDEPVVGGFINSFYLLIIGFLFMNLKNKKIVVLFSIIFLFAIFITGERSNSIRALAGFLIFYSILKEFNLKVKIIAGISVITLLAFMIVNSNYLKVRYGSQIKSHLSQDKIYFKLYRSGFEVFKNFKIFGVGNKNYRIETCKLDKKENYYCTTHPHQIYFEMLSEHGILGSILIFAVLYKIIFSKIVKTLRNNNYIMMGSLIYLMLIFLPLLPSGAFFNDYMLTLFMINLSIFYSSSRALNIFRKQE